MKKNILIYEHDKETLKFLRAFFKASDDYSAKFIQKDVGRLKRRSLQEETHALIINSPVGLERIKPEWFKCPIIAFISTPRLVDGIRTAIKSGIEHYLISPFYKEDFEYKLKVAIERKKWFENIYVKERDLESLLEFACLISSTLNPKEALFLIVKKISEILDVSRCSIISIDVENPDSAHVISTFEDPEITNIKLDLRYYPEIRQAVASKRPLLIQDAMKDDLMKDVRETIIALGISSIAVFPVIFRDEVIGILLLKASKSGHTFTEREIKLFSSIANASANPLHNAFLYEGLEKEKTKLEKLSYTDFMTGIYNIRYFYNRLEEEFSRAVRYEIPLSCIMFDIDHFKRINDTYGHRVGDIVLREFAQLLRGLSRKSDIFARYGGEEFIMLLPQTSKENAVIKADQMRNSVQEYQFMGLQNNERITVSIGIACLPDESIKTHDDLITFTDQALFVAKNSGRNQLVTYPEGV